MISWGIYKDKIIKTISDIYIGLYWFQIVLTMNLVQNYMNIC